MSTLTPTQTDTAEAWQAPERGDQPARLRVWLRAIRPATLPAAIAPVVVGTALAARDGKLHLAAAAAALVAAVLIQIGTNLANDYFDWRKGADTDERIGPARVTQRGWVQPAAVARATALVFAAAAVVGIYLVARAGWPVLLIGIISILCGIAYTGGPLPLGYYGLGDFAVFIFFGPVAVCGTYYVQALELAPATLWLSPGVGTLITAILVVNNIRDRRSDRLAGKHTLAVRWGLRASRIEYALLVLAPYAVLPIAWRFGSGTLTWLLPWLSLPLAIALVLRLLRSDGSALNAHLGRTARLALIYSLLLTLGVLL